MRLAIPLLACVLLVLGCDDDTNPGGDPGGGADASTVCTDQCPSESMKVCDGNAFKTCERGDDGCLAWSGKTACEGGQFCDSGECRKNCADQCSTENQKVCEGTGWTKTCVRQPSGCLGWATPAACPTNEVCEAGACKKNCSDSCPFDGAKACDGNGTKVCAKQTNGCLGWNKTTPCASSEICDSGVCKKNCSDTCQVENQKVCEGNGVKECQRQTSGCLAWTQATPCGTYEACDQGVCKKDCTDKCQAGAALCDAGGVKTCALSASGCYDWGTPAGCGGAQVCSGGRCVDSCQDVCTEGTKMCAGSGTLECKKLATGCTDWASPAACANNTVCSGGQCVATCSDKCTLGHTRCTGGGLIQTCVDLPTGCSDWSLPTACASGKTCPSSGDSCVVRPCQVGEKRCSGNVVETCDVAANWVPTQNCPQACNGGQCTAAAACNAGTIRCNGSSVEVCNSSGTAWLYLETCNVGCNKGVCTDPCTPGTKRCNGKTPETCNAAGTGWTAGSICSTDCHLGGCIQADLIIDATTKEMEGEHVFLNSVVIRNNAQLKVGASGRLILRAKTITVDATSHINATALGNATEGTGGSCCRNSSYCSSDACVSSPDGSGAGYGTGGACSRNLYNCYYYGNRNCSVSDGQTYGSTNQIDIAEGSKDNFGKKGGGLVMLVAQSVDIAGQIVANGEGNASGGGVLVAADTIKTTGPIQTVGGGCGGKGRVKLLRGSTVDVKGAVDGARSDSVMPPMKIVSGSHPDPERWYNDGLGDWFIAWEKPFPNLNGYYVKSSTAAVDVPGPGKGTFQLAGQETYVVAADKLSQGSNYFHVVSVDASSVPGTVENVLKVQVNTAPPSVSSSSHQQKTWTTDNALYLTWTNPQADSNFTGYYYVLDHFADTVPSKAQGTLVNQKQLLLPNLTNGIWVFHLVNRDTREATTKAAAHYVVYIGANPGQGSLSGSVFDGSNGNVGLSGATLKVNRGLSSTSTAGNGTYAFTNNLYAGTWELTASKPGYVSQTKTVEVQSGLTTTGINFTLVKTP